MYWHRDERSKTSRDQTSSAQAGNTSKRAAKPRGTAAKPSVWERAIELRQQIPEEELKNWPRAGTRNLDHYLYGAPKQYPTADGYTGNTMSVRKPAATKAAARKPTTTSKRVAKPRSKAAKPSVWDELAAIGAKMPQEVVDQLPRDLARNFDHYLDGSPKQY